MASSGSADRHPVDARTLYQHYGDALNAFCVARLGDREEAADVVQDTFLKAWLALRRGTEPEAPYAWLLTIAHNLCVSRYRARSVRPRVARLDEKHAQLASRPGSPDALLELKPLLRRLPEQQRLAFLLYEIQGLSHREVAAKLGLSYAATATLVFRARKALAQGLAADRDGEQPAKAPSWGSLLGMLEPLVGGGAPAKVALLASVAPLALLPSSSVPRSPAHASRPAAVTATGPPTATSSLMTPPLVTPPPPGVPAEQTSRRKTVRTTVDETPTAASRSLRSGGDEAGSGAAPSTGQAPSHSSAADGPGAVEHSPPSDSAKASSRSPSTPSPAPPNAKPVGAADAGSTGGSGQEQAKGPPADPGGQSQDNGPPTNPGSQSQGNGPPTNPGSQSQGNGPPTSPGAQSQSNGPPTNPGSQSQGNGPPTNPGSQSQSLGNAPAVNPDIQSQGPPADPGAQSQGNGPPANPDTQSQGNEPPANPDSQSNGPPASPDTQSQGPPADPGAQSQGSAPAVSSDTGSQSSASTADPAAESRGNAPPAKPSTPSQGNGGH